MRAPIRTAAAAAGVAVFTLTTLAPHAQDTPVMSAMADELARSMKELRMKDQPAPYYIEYEVWDRAQTRVTSRLGALTEDLTGKDRTLRVGVRVGDYNFDSSLFNAPGTNGGGVVTLSAASAYSIVKSGDDMLVSYGWPALLTGFLAAWISAALAVKWMVAWLNRHGMAVFAWWRFAAAAAAAWLLL